jgi:hypothetical protein
MFGTLRSVAEHVCPERMMLYEYGAEMQLAFEPRMFPTIRHPGRLWPYEITVCPGANELKRMSTFPPEP